jgi:hypothetical protein
MKFSPIRHPCPLGDKARLYFKPLADGRLQCTQCNKPVKDLAGCTPEQITEYVKANPGTCIVLGRQKMA